MVTTKPTVVLAQLEAYGCTAELYLNGVPVCRLTPEHVPLRNSAVEQLLIPGRNWMELLVEPGSTPSIARTERRELPFREIRAVARLLRFEDGAIGHKEGGQLLGATQVLWMEGDAPTREFPVLNSVEIEMGAAKGRWGWQDAPPMRMSQRLWDDALAVIEEVEAAMRAGDEDRFWRLTELQLQDMLRAYPAVSRDDMWEDLKRRMQTYGRRDDAVFERDPTQHDFRLVSGGRLLELVDKDWSTSVKIRNPKTGNPLPFRIMLANIGGVLRIIR